MVNDVDAEHRNGCALLHIYLSLLLNSVPAAEDRHLVASDSAAGRRFHWSKFHVHHKATIKSAVLQTSQVKNAWRCRKSRCQPRFATSEPKTISYPLHRSWRMRLVPLCGDSVRDGRPPGAWGGIQILGTGTRPMAWPRSDRRVCLRLGRNQFDECAHSLSEISSFSLPAAYRRSTRVFNQHTAVFDFAA